jgi:aspartate 1-decarboxylase
MQIKVLKSKIHNATVTNHNVDYDGSIGVDPGLLDAVNLVPFEKVHLLNIDNGERLETYVIKGRRGSSEVSIYGAAAHKIKTGHRIIILSYALINLNESNSFNPKVVHLNTNNQII